MQTERGRKAMALYDELRKVLMAGVGAVAVTAEKAKEIADGLIEKGELTVEQGKFVSDAFCKNVSEKVDRAAKKVDMSAKMMALSPEELEQVKEIIARMQRERAQEADGSPDAGDGVQAAEPADEAEAEEEAGDAAPEDAPGEADETNG